MIRLELLKLLRDSRLAILMGAFASVLLLSGIAALVEVRQSADIKAAVAAEERQRWLGQGEKDPHSAAHYSIYAFKPALPLQAVDPGILPFVGEAVWLEAHLQNDLLARPQQDATSFERLGLIDPAGLLTRFGPLAVFLLAFAAAARERESGVLALAFGNAPARGPYVAAKVIAVAATSLITLVLPIVAIGTLSIALGLNPVTDDFVRLAGWTVSATAYVTLMSVIGVSICLTARSVQMAFGGLLLAWIVLALAALPTASALARWRSPVPSFQQMKLVLVDEAPAYWSPEAGARQIENILQRYGVSRESELAARSVNVRGAQLDLAERHAQEVFDREIGGFYDQVARQDTSYARLGWIWPAVAFDVASAAFTGTDFSHHRHFIDLAESYRRGLVNRMNADLLPNPAINGAEHTNNIALWSEVPAFAYVPLPASHACRLSGSALLALTGWLVAGWAVCAFCLKYVRP